MPINLECDNANIDVFYGGTGKIYDRPNHGWGYLALTDDFVLSLSCAQN